MSTVVTERIDKLVGVFTLSILLGGAINKVVEKALNAHFSDPVPLLVACSTWGTLVLILWIFWPTIEDED